MNLARPQSLGRLVGRFFMLLLLCNLAMPAAAQGQGVTTPELERLVSTLESDQDRQQLIEQLRALIAAQEEAAPEERPSSLGAQIIGGLTDQIEVIGEQVSVAARVASDLPELWNWVLGQFEDPRAMERWQSIIGQFLAILVAGYLAQLFTELLLTRAQRAVESKRSQSLALRIPLAFLQFIVFALPLAVFAGIAYLVLGLLRVEGDARVAAVMLVSAYISARLVMALMRVLLAPRIPAGRLIPLADETAWYLWVWSRRLVGIAVFGYFLIEAGRLLGLPGGAATFLLKLLGLIVAAMLVIFTLQNRQAVGHWIATPDTERDRVSRRIEAFRQRLGDVWHVLVILYIAALFIVFALQIAGGFAYLLRATVLTLVIGVLALLISAALHNLVNRGFAISDEMRAQYPKLEDRANRYLPVLHNALRLFIALAALIALMEAWGVDAVAWLATGAGARIVSSGVTIFFVLAVALIVWEMVNSSIERYLAQTDENGNAVERSARARTLLPLARNAILIVLLVIVALIVLSELGINIAPLLAGAGVVGLAIGFGSQKLVQDIITGAFFLFEDTVSVGDVADLGNGHAGLVEAINIRSIRLRDLNGTVHTVPFSSVATIKNLTKDFSYYLLNVGIAYREDTDEVTVVLKDILEEMRNDEEFAPLILEPLEVLGVDAFADSAVIIKARIKTPPIKQWTVGREFNRRMKKKFDALGIEIPFPHQTIYFGVDKQGKAPLAHIELQKLVEAQE